MDFALIFAPLATGVTEAVTDTLPVALPVLVLLASISIALAVFRKVGIKR